MTTKLSMTLTMLFDGPNIDKEAIKENVRVALVVARQEGELTPHDEDHPMLTDFGVRLKSDGSETVPELPRSVSSLTFKFTMGDDKHVLSFYRADNGVVIELHDGTAPVAFKVLEPEVLKRLAEMLA